jgi:hypothetical protein
MRLPASWLDPPHEFSVMPFWFWNDALDDAEIVRQIADFEAHGVYGFVIHPRVGLPRDLGWMSDRLLHFYQIAIDEAHRRDMYVLLYDEGMYPSGSSSGQVVASDPLFQTCCLAKIDFWPGEQPRLRPGEHLVTVAARANGERLAVIDRKADSFIRGLHYAGDGPAEDEPPAGDILNPAAVARFIELVYDKLAARFSAHFGKTIIGMFTDEPSLLGRCRERGVWPGTTGVIEHINRILGYDFAPHLPALWYDDEGDAARFRADYRRALHVRLEETYYAQLHDWCEAHHLPLAGHPEGADDIGALRYFHIPGQDLVWRWVLPDRRSALSGPQSTQGKCASSAALHLGRRRNANELCGAYGHELTWDEMTWLANWCFIRGANLLYPHAFYYSVRGSRWDERPPDVGPHAAWWDHYRQYADACRLLSSLNTDSIHVCNIAILGEADRLPWRAARVCFQHQRDFNYLEERHLWQGARVDETGISIAGMHYDVLIVEGPANVSAQPALAVLERAGRLIRFTKGRRSGWLVRRLDAGAPADVCVTPATPGLRLRHVIKDGLHCYMLFNEEKAPIEMTSHLSAGGDLTLWDVWTGTSRAVAPGAPLAMQGHEMLVVVSSSPPVYSQQNVFGSM